MVFIVRHLMDNLYETPGDTVTLPAFQLSGANQVSHIIYLLSLSIKALYAVSHSFCPLVCLSYRMTSLRKFCVDAAEKLTEKLSPTDWAHLERVFISKAGVWQAMLAGGTAAIAINQFLTNAQLKGFQHHNNMQLENFQHDNTVQLEHFQQQLENFQHDNTVQLENFQHHNNMQLEHFQHDNTVQLERFGDMMDIKMRKAIRETIIEMASPLQFPAAKPGDT